MATVKSYTSLEQSKKLAVFLPLESADMVLLHEEPYETSDSMFDGLHQALCVPFTKYDKSWRQKYKNISYFPCWSLASLLGVLPEKYTELIKEGSMYRILIKDSYMTSLFDNPVNACVAMIIYLHELNLL